MLATKAVLLSALAALTSASDVVVVTDKSFDAFVAENKHTMVEFYAPWCGHCKSLEPEYDTAATALKEFDIKIGKVDATVESALKSRFDVSGFPTIKIFTDGKDSEYEGGRTSAAIINAMRAAKDPDYKPPAPAGSVWTDSGAVVHGTEDSWAERPAKALVMFYAPWCGHCKALKPTFVKVADEIEGSWEGEENVKIMGVDCTTTGDLCKKFGVESYPTLIFFDNAEDEKGTKYEGGRSKKDLKKFVKKKIDPEWKDVVAPFADPQAWEEEEFGNGNMVHLEDDHFDDYRNNKAKAMLVMFYAPWCGHCKNMKPEIVAASEAHKTITFAAVDCTVATETCQAVGTTGYPTLRYFVPSVEGAKEETKEGAKGEDVGQVRTKEDLSWFANDKVDKMARAQAKAATEAAASGEVTEKQLKKMRVKALKKLLKDRGAKCEGCTSKKEFVAMVLKVIKDPVVTKKHTGRTLMAEKKYQEAVLTAKKGWSEEDFGNGEVDHLIEDTFDAYIKENKHVVMMFYAPWCGHCKALKPDWVKASKALKEDAIAAKMAAIDCTVASATCKKYKATSYPTLVTFADGQDMAFEGGRSAKALTEAAKKLVDPAYVAVVEPFSDPQVWESEDHGNGAVVHLGDEHFKSYRAEHPKVFVMFYAPWCGHCKALKPDFVKASTAAKEAGVVLAAVDCTVDKTVCAEFGVEGYPTIKYYTSATDKGTAFDGSRDEAGIMSVVREMAGGQTAELKDDAEDDDIDKDEL